MIRTLAVMALLVVLPGCVRDEPSIMLGTCVDAETRDYGSRVPDLSRAVPCTRPHVYEVFDLINLPRRVLPASWIENRDDLADSSKASDPSPRHAAFRDFAKRQCLLSLQRATGFDAVEVNGKSAAAVELMPALRGIDAPWYSVVPEQLWRDGRRQVVCSARFRLPSETSFGRRVLEPRRSPTSAPLLSLAWTSRFPDTLRPCRAYDADRTALSLVPCSEKHVSETLFFFDAEKGMGKKFVAQLTAAPTAELFDRVDDVCTRTLPQVLGKGYGRTKYHGFGSVPRPWTSTSHPLQCAVGPIDFENEDLAAGSLVNIDRPAPEPPPMPDVTWNPHVEWP